MAKFFDLKRRENTYEKRGITKEEVEFLMNLQKDINTQDNASTADPLYWTILDTKKIYGEKLDDPDGFIVYDTMNTEEVCDSEDYDNFTKEIVTKILNDNDFHKDDFVKEQWALLINSFDTEDLAENLNDATGEDGRFIHLQYKRVEEESNCFLSAEDAQNFLKSNDYHYSDDCHIYGHHAWRNPEMDKLLKILHEVDFEKIYKSFE